MLSQCERCEKEFVGIIHFKHHICKPDSKFQCELCEFGAVTIHELLDHMEKEHTNKPSSNNRIQCYQCPHIAEDGQTLLKHVKNDHTKFHR